MVTIQLLDAGRQQSQSVGLWHAIGAKSLPQSGNILAGYRGIGADVHHINTIDVVPQVVDCSRQQSTCNDSLAKADLVRNEEAAGRVNVFVEASGHMVNGQALKVL